MRLKTQGVLIEVTEEEKGLIIAALDLYRQEYENKTGVPASRLSNMDRAIRAIDLMIKINKAGVY